uniref:Uncharacterized protein n=1 Tax=Anguilla anguilla TaxID=7936 RepID=A0A0E9P5J8_ANGAN
MAEGTKQYNFVGLVLDLSHWIM